MVGPSMQLLVTVPNCHSNPVSVAATYASRGLRWVNVLIWPGSNNQSTRAVLSTLLWAQLHEFG